MMYLIWIVVDIILMCLVMLGNETINILHAINFETLVIESNHELH